MDKLDFGALDLPQPKMNFIESYVCEGCNRPVRIYETKILGGPEKGKLIKVEKRETIDKVDYGCKCADMKLANKSIERQRKLKANKMQRFFDENSLVNRSLQKATLENYVPTTNALAQAKQQITSFIDSFNGEENLLIHGTYGTGKSHLSIATTKKLIDKGYSCLFLSLPKLLTKIRDTYNNDDMTEDKLLEHIQSVDLLVLDDLGAEQKTEWSIPKLFEVMDSRAGKSTIYTTNLSSKELKKHMNERNFSRLMEDTEIIIMNGDDYRRKEF